MRRLRVPFEMVWLLAALWLLPLLTLLTDPNYWQAVLVSLQSLI